MTSLLSFLGSESGVVYTQETIQPSLFTGVMLIIGGVLAPFSSAFAGSCEAICCFGTEWCTKTCDEGYVCVAGCAGIFSCTAICQCLSLGGS